MGYIKSLDDKKYINHKFIVAFKIEHKQSLLNPYRVYADTANNMAYVLGDFPTFEAANREVERLIKKMYIDKEILVEVK